MDDHNTPVTFSHSGIWRIRDMLGDSLGPVACPQCGEQLEPMLCNHTIASPTWYVECRPALVHGSVLRRIIVVMLPSGVATDEVSETEPVPVREVPPGFPTTPSTPGEPCPVASLVANASTRTSRLRRR